MPLHVSSTRAHRQETKSLLYNLWLYSKINQLTNLMH